MPISAWNFAAGQRLLPTGIIIGLSAGATLEDDWSYFDDANSYYIKGTTDDGALGEINPKVTANIASGSGGSHLGSANLAMGDRGTYPDGSHIVSWSRYESVRGDHTGHIVTIDHSPSKTDLRLIRCSKNVPIPIGGVMFGTDENDKQTPLSSADGTFLGANTATQLVPEVTGTGTTTAVSGSHHHGQSDAGGGTRSIYGPQSFDDQMGSHTHSGGTATVVENLDKIYLRAFEIIDSANISGLIGMWLGTDIPAEWELVAEANDKYIKLTDDNGLAGTTAGDGTINVNGTTGDYSHRHYGTGSSISNWSEYQRHANWEVHNHAYSGDISVTLDEYKVKFIRLK